MQASQVYWTVYAILLQVAHHTGEISAATNIVHTLVLHNCSLWKTAISTQHIHVL